MAGGGRAGPGHLPLGVGAQLHGHRPAAGRPDLGRADSAGELGRTTVDVLLRMAAEPGPVLADFGDFRVGFFVPPGTAARWVGTGVRTAGPGAWLAVPHPGRSGRGLRWLVPPDGSGLLNDPALLELAMHEAAALLVSDPDRGWSDEV